MHAPSSLDDYRHAIRHANTSEDLELLLYRALPLVYKELGVAFEPEQHLNVQTKLSRLDEGWQLWFNIEAPQALNVLAHLDASLFNRMNGTNTMASAIAKGRYGIGFSQTTLPFSLAPVFEERQALSSTRLNEASSLQQWWNVFYEELAWEVVKARGWEEPTAPQWAYAQSMAQSCRTAHEDTLKALYMCSGALRDGVATCKAWWSQRATEFSNCLDVRFYPLFRYHPYISLTNQGVFKMGIDNIDLNGLSKGLMARGKDFVFAHCSLEETSTVPPYLLRAALDHSPELPLALPDHLASTRSF